MDDLSNFRYFRLILFCFVFALVAGISGCITGECSREEQNRVTSPDGMVDAVFVEVNCGATTGYVANVFVVPKGMKPEKWDPDQSLFTADRYRGLKLTWNGAKQLEIQYDQARIFHFSNFWRSSEIKDFKYVVELHLVPTQSKSPES